jgi:hypothetical protein
MSKVDYFFTDLFTTSKCEFCYHNRYAFRLVVKINKKEEEFIGCYDCITKITKVLKKFVK